MCVYIEDHLQAPPRTIFVSGNLVCDYVLSVQVVSKWLSLQQGDKINRSKQRNGWSKVFVFIPEILERLNNDLGLHKIKLQCQNTKSSKQKQVYFKIRHVAIDKSQSVKERFLNWYCLLLSVDKFFQFRTHFLNLLTILLEQNSIFNL